MFFFILVTEDLIKCDRCKHAILTAMCRPHLHLFETFMVTLMPEEGFVSNDSLHPVCRYFQMIVIPLAKGKDPGNPSDTKFETIKRKYGDQVEGEPYITAEFEKDDSRTTFTVGDEKFYARSTISDDKRKRRDVSCRLITEHNF